MKTLIHAAVCYLAGVMLAGAQVVYSGGTLAQNFNTPTLSNNTDGGALDLVKSATWSDNTTIQGWYSSASNYTTVPGVAPGLGLGVGIFNRLVSQGVGTSTDRSLGMVLGALSLGAPISYGVRIENGFLTPMTQFTLTFDIESSVNGLVPTLAAADVLSAFNLSYRTSANDTDNLGTGTYQTIAGSGVNLLSASILNSSTSSQQVSYTVGGLNVAPGDNLWIKFERSSLIGVADNTIAIDNLNFTAVPEPSTYAMLGLGLAALVVLRKNKFSIGRTATKNIAAVVLLAGIALLPALQAQEETPTPSAPMEETVVRSTAPETPATVSNTKETGGSAQTYEYQPQWNRMMLKKDFETTYKTEIEKGEIAIMEPSQYFKSVKNYHVSTGNNSTPPQTVWLLHESYLLRGSAGHNSAQKIEAPQLELPIARPNNLMPVIDTGAELFGNAPLSQDEYFNKMFYLRTEFMDTTEKVKGLLKIWDTGSISPQDLATLQSASKVEWLVSCQLLPESREIDNLLDSVFRRTNVRLTPAPMTPTGL